MQATPALSARLGYHSIRRGVCQQGMQGEGVAEGGSGGGVVEDDPGSGLGGSGAKSGGEGFEVFGAIGGVVGARGTVETEVEEIAGGGGVRGFRDTGGVGGDTGYVVGGQEGGGFGCEPRGVARLEREGAGVEVAQMGEKGMGAAGFEGLFGRELEEDGA